MDNMSPPQGASPGSPMAGDMALPAPAPTVEMGNPSAPPAMGLDQTQMEDERREQMVRQLLEETNVAKKIKEDERTRIGREALEGYQIDLQSRKEWDLMYEEAMKLALLYKEDKTYPWPKAANVKFPLIATAAMQFSARAYPTLVPSNGKIVKTKIIGKDPDGMKAQLGEKISRHMSYQLMEEMEEWEEDMDKLLYCTAIVGTTFKKTYFDSTLNRNVSKLILPKNLVVNYWSRSLEDAPRVSEIMEMSKNEVHERMKDGRWLDIKLEEPSVAAHPVDQIKQQLVNQPPLDPMVPYRIIEQHTWLDLDDDGYAEPYVVVFEERSGKLLRIAARYDADNIKENDDGEVIRIIPNCYYTKFSFFPNPDGGFYDLGFGSILSGINQSVDTLINQLIDAGSLKNLQSGFISKAIKLRPGDQRFQPGEWKQINIPSDDIKKGIFPLPTSEPSKVLLELLSLLIQSGKELASIAEIFVGKMPGQNTPAYTTKETVEQGMKLFTAIYKRIYRSLTKEFKKLFRLNYTYLDEEVYVAVLDEPISFMDYDEEKYDVCPAADPGAASSAEKQARFQGIMQLMPLGTLNPMAVTMEGLQALEIDNPERLTHQGPPPPNPEEAKMQMEAQIKQQESQAKIQIEQMKAEIKKAEGEMKIALEQRLGEMKIQFEQMKMGLEAQKMQMQQQATMQTTQTDMVANEMTHQQGMRHAEDNHKMKMKEAEANAKSPATKQTPVSSGKGKVKK